ncbi:MAG: hypothetical protein RLZZ283_553 [Candidatus Parcubacteria bacterium]|jgi:hypothetical protein
MQERVTTSFIPKESLTSERKRTPNPGNPFAIVNIITGFILLVAVLASAGLFLFENYTKGAIEAKKASLDRQRAAFEPATIKALARLDRRLDAGGRLLKGHVALSNIFQELEARSVQSLRFTDFSYAAGNLGSMVIIMNGEATSFNAVAVQADSLGASPLFQDPIFSNLNIDKDGTVIFTFTANVDPSRISYATLLAGAGAAAQPEELAPPAETGTTTAP